MRGIRVELFDGAGDRPNLTIANGTMIYADDRRDLCSCPAHEDFVSYVQLGAIDCCSRVIRPNSRLASSITKIAGDTKQDILGWGRCYKLAIHYQEDIFRTAFRDMAFVGKHDGFVEAVLHSFAFRESRIDVSATNLCAGRNSVVVDTSP